MVNDSIKKGLVSIDHRKTTETLAESIVRISNVSFKSWLIVDLKWFTSTIIDLKYTNKYDNKPHITL